MPRKSYPEWIEIFDNFAFDEVLRDSKLETRTRLMIQFAAMIACQAVSEYRVMLGAALTVAGLIGTLYSIRNVFLMRRQSAYIPALYDWTFYAVLPISACVFLAAVSVWPGTALLTMTSRASPTSSNRLTCA